MPKRKQTYKYEHVLTTLANLLAATEQEAVLHPYPLLRSKAEALVPVMRDILRSVSHEPLTKNELLNRIAQHRTETRDQAAAIPLMRTPITANRLERDSALHSFETARSLVAAGRAVSQASKSEEGERWEWMAKAIDVLEAKGFKRVHFTALSELSLTGVNYPLPEVADS